MALFVCLGALPALGLGQVAMAISHSFQIETSEGCCPWAWNSSGSQPAVRWTLAWSTELGNLLILLAFEPAQIEPWVRGCWGTCCRASRFGIGAGFPWDMRRAPSFSCYNPVVRACLWMPGWNRTIFKSSTSLRYNLYTLKCTHLKYPVLWVLKMYTLG